MKKIVIFFAFLFSYIALFAQENTEYKDGVFFVNEDWYGHTNGSVNFLSTDGVWDYNIFRKANEGRELGCTTQYGTIYGDKFYLVSKQERDPGSQITGSRFTVCDALTMKCLKEFTTIAIDESNKSIADGRSFLGIDEKKGYIGTSNGIWLYDMEKMEIGNQIPGTGNPNGSGYGQLYYAQIGTMIRTDMYVFAVHQQNGVQVIDPVADTVVTIIAPPEYTDVNGNIKSRGFGSIVQSKDGNLWISMAANTSGNGATLPYILRMDPYTFAADTIYIPEGIEDVPNSWYAWTADSFCSSIKENKIYWDGNNGNSWFKGHRIFCYDIDHGTFSKVFDFDDIPGNWIIYGAGFRLHPETDDIYCSVFHELSDPTYQVVKLNNKGELLTEYPMITHYWFPAIPVFHDNHAPEINISEIESFDDGYTLRLNDYITDLDSPVASIVKTIEENSNPEIFDAVIESGNLNIKPHSIGEGTISLKINSNGKIAQKNILVRVIDGSSVNDFQNDIYKAYINGGELFIKNGEGYSFNLYSLNGNLFRSFTVNNNDYRIDIGLSSGIYILKGNKNRSVVSSKLVVK